jgi:HSP20 family protein
MSLMRRNWPFDNSLTQWDDADFGWNSMLRRMNNLERALFPDSGDNRQSVLSMNPSVDVKETDTHVQIIADMPGMEKKDIKIDLDEDNRVLTLSGERNYEKEDKNDKYHFKERKYGSFKRSFVLPENVQMEQIKANMNNGLLNVEIPKIVNKKENKKRSIEIGESA